MLVKLYTAFFQPRNRCGRCICLPRGFIDTLLSVSIWGSGIVISCFFWDIAGLRHFFLPFWSTLKSFWSWLSASLARRSSSFWLFFCSASRRRNSLLAALICFLFLTKRCFSSFSCCRRSISCSLDVLAISIAAFFLLCSCRACCILPGEQNIV